MPGTELKAGETDVRDPIEVACMVLMGVLAWSGAVIPALMLFGMLVACIVDRAVSGGRS